MGAGGEKSIPFPLGGLGKGEGMSTSDTFCKGGGVLVRVRGPSASLPSSPSTASPRSSSSSARSSSGSNKLLLPILLARFSACSTSADQRASRASTESSTSLVDRVGGAGVGGSEDADSGAGGGRSIGDMREVGDGAAERSARCHSSRQGRGGVDRVSTSLSTSSASLNSAPSAPAEDLPTPSKNSLISSLEGVSTPSNACP